MNELLQILENNGRISHEALARMLDKEVGDIKKMIEDYEREGVILGYKTMIDWDKTDKEYVSALIELKITPQMGKGYEHVAQKIIGYNEVEIAAIYTEWRAKRGDMRKYSKSCVSKHLNNAKFRLRYRKVPF